MHCTKWAIRIAMHFCLDFWPPLTTNIIVCPMRHLTIITDCLTIQVLYLLVSVQLLIIKLQLPMPYMEKAQNLIKNPILKSHQPLLVYKLLDKRKVAKRESGNKPMFFHFSEC